MSRKVMLLFAPPQLRSLVVIFCVSYQSVSPKTNFRIFFSPTVRLRVGMSLSLAFDDGAGPIVAARGANAQDGLAGGASGGRARRAGATRRRRLRRASRHWGDDMR